MTTFFFPDLRATNGFGLRTSRARGEKTHGKSRRQHACVAERRIELNIYRSGGDSSITWCFCRGNGGGSSGKMSNKASSSDRAGIGVVRALCIKNRSCRKDEERVQLSLT